VCEPAVNELNMHKRYNKVLEMIALKTHTSFLAQFVTVANFLFEEPNELIVL